MLDFDSPKNREKSLADLRSLVDHPGWILVKEIAEFNMETIKNQILMGIGEETLETINRLRDRLRYIQELVDSPKKMIEKLQPVDEIEQNEDDPYPYVGMPDQPDVV